MANFTRAALLEFLDYLANKGLMNPTTASARKASVSKVLGVLDEEEASDVSRIDVNDVMNRFHNLEGSNYTPGSLNTYKSRVQSAIDDFLRYQKDPLNFRPTVQAVGRKNGEKTKSRLQQKLPGEVTESIRNVEPPPASVSILPIPIRPNLTIKIQGLPYDLTPSEANKIANVIKAMAAGD